MCVNVKLHLKRNITHSHSTGYIFVFQMFKNGGYEEKCNLIHSWCTWKGYFNVRTSGLWKSCLIAIAEEEVKWINYIKILVTIWRENILHRILFHTLLPPRSVCSSVFFWILWHVISSNRMTALNGYFASLTLNCKILN